VPLARITRSAPPSGGLVQRSRGSPARPRPACRSRRGARPACIWVARCGPRAAVQVWLCEAARPPDRSRAASGATSSWAAVCF